jgi:hypothetical protein
MRSVFEKQSVRRTNRLIRVRKLMCLLSIFCVCAFPTVCCSCVAKKLKHPFFPVVIVTVVPVYS